MALQCVHDAARFGATAEAAHRVEKLADTVEGRLAERLVAHVIARAQSSPEPLEHAARDLAEVGCWAAAADAAHEAAAALAAVHRRADATRLRVDAARFAALASSRTVHDDARRWLTAREHEIGLLAARGGSDRLIADTLGISVRTVTTHLHRVYAKLGVTDGRSGLAAALHTSDT
jgi:DNA-binding CsgD family transcriptional regulator